MEGLPLTCFFSTKLLFAPLRGKMWTVTIRLGYADTVLVLGSSIMVISLSMYVMAAGISTLQGTLFHGRPICTPTSALQVLFAGDASAGQAPITYQPSSDSSFSHTAQLQLVTSACVSACPACA